VGRSLACIATVLSLASSASAQSKREAQARALFDEAVRLREGGQEALACPKLEQARKLFTSAGLLFNLADCYEKVGRVEQARSTFDEAARIASRAGRDDIATEATRRHDALIPPAAASASASASGPAPAPAPTTPSPDELAARALFEEGRGLRDSGQYAAACEKFEAATKRFASAGVAFNLADCYAKVGRTASAWTAFRDAATMGRQANRSGISEQAERAASEIEPKLMRLTIQVPHAGPGLTVKRDSVFVPQPSWSSAMAVDPGPHEVRAEAPGREPWSVSVNVSSPGETVTVEIPELRPTAPAPMAPVPAAPETATGAGPRDVVKEESLGPEWAWIDGDVGGAYAYAANVNTTTGAHQSGARSGPTFSVGAGVRLGDVTLGFRARNVDLPTFNVWEMDGEAAFHTRLDRFDGHLGLRTGYAFMNPASGGASGFDAGVLFGCDYYLSHWVSLGLEVSPELVWLSRASQSGVSLGTEAMARLGAHF
jgi:Tfp pilus assembly protein PilF